MTGISIGFNSVKLLFLILLHHLISYYSMTATSNDSGSGSETSIESIDPINSSQVQLQPQPPLLYTILPSYHMYQAIVAKSLTLSPENIQALPSYSPQLKPVGTEGIELDFDYNIGPSTDSTYNHQYSTHSNLSPHPTSYFSSTMGSEASLSSVEDLTRLSIDSSTRSSISHSSTVAFETTGGASSVADPRTFISSERILNSHNSLRHLNTQSVSMDIHFTADEGRPGVVPNLINLDSHSFTTGDVIHGFVVIESQVVTNFSRFYVLFEGNVLVHRNIFTSSKMNMKPSRVINFLQSVDLSASFNYSSIEQTSEYDPIDDTRLVFNNERIIYPGVRYKRFFSFKVPETLLDSYCKDESMIRHKELPPSMEGGKNGSNRSLSFINTSIEYSIQAKCIGQDYLANEFIVLKDSTTNVNVIPQSVKLNATEDELHKSDMKFLQDNLRSRVNHYITKGKQLRKLIPEDSPEDLKMAYHPIPKNPQTYKEGVSTTNSSTIHRTILPITKKTFGTHSKEIGSLSVSVQTSEHKIQYIAQRHFRTHEPTEKDLNSWKIHVPVHLEYSTSATSNKIPEVVDISATLEVFTIMSDTNQIPMEFDFEHIFNNETKEDFNSLIIEPYKKLNNELYEQVKNLPEGTEMPIETQLISDIKSIVGLRTKKSVLDINGISIFNSRKLNSSKIPWSTRNSSSCTKDLDVSIDISNTFQKDFQVSLDFTNTHLRKSYSSNNGEIPTYDMYDMIPSHQNCIIARLYYVQVQLYFLNGTTVSSKIPVTIAN